MSIIFNPTNHTYTKDGKNYTSVTTFLKKFHKPFYGKEIAKSLIETNPKYQNYTVTQLLNEWSESANLGTQVHAKLESFFYKKPKKETRLYKAWYSTNLFSNAELDYKPEYLIHSDQYLLAGTSDVVIFNHTKKTFLVVDFKTNKKIWEKSFDGTKMYEPIAHLEDCNFNHYTLQLSLYTYMIEKNTNYTPFAPFILHLDPEKIKDKNEKLQFVIKKIPYLKSEIESLLNFS